MITYPNLYSLRYFVDAVELGSVSAAAVKNRVTHSAVSRAISQLEIDLGVNLLVHQKRRFQVTEAGHDLAQKAVPLLEDAKKFQKTRLSGEAQERLELSIGISRSLGSIYLPSLMNVIKRQFPGAQIRIKFGTSSEISAWIASGLVDCGIALDPQKMPTLKFDKIADGKFVLIDSSLNAAEAWEKRSFLITEPRPETEVLKREFGKRFRKSLPVSVEVESWDAIAEMVEKKIGTGLVPDFLIQLPRHSQLKTVQTPWFQFSYSIYVISLKKQSHHKVMKLIFDHFLKLRMRNN